MPPFDTSEEFEATVRHAVSVVTPTAAVERVSRSIVAIKLRIDLSSRRFVDIFFNSRNQRTDLSVIQDGSRLFGYDNLGGWHRHPLAGPESHEPCAEPSLEEFFREAIRVPE